MQCLSMHSGINYVSTIGYFGNHNVEINGIHTPKESMD